MSSVLQRLNWLAACILGGVLGAALVAQIWPRGRALAQGRMTEQAAKEEAEWTWPKTLQLCPAHRGDPVKLVKVAKRGEQLQPGKYELPQVAGDIVQTNGAVQVWLRDVSFTLRSEAPKNVASVGMAVVFPVRRTGFDCLSIGGTDQHWCDAHPHWCDGGCPVITHCTMHWGFIPATAASGLQARYRAESKGMYGDRGVLQGTAALLLAPGGEVTLSANGRFDGLISSSDPRGGLFPSVMNGILWEEGIEEAKDAAPCAERANSKAGCAFAEVSKFNVGIDVVYFDDGTIWGNYGYGYATPNPDGIFTRVTTADSPGIGDPVSGPN